VTLAGPVRGVAYRNNSIVVVPPLAQTINNELYHSEIILIPFNTPYFTWQFYGKWLKATTLDYRYLSVVGQISGTSSDQGSQVRPQYSSLQLDPTNVNTTQTRRIINGSYATSNVQHRHVSSGGSFINDAYNYGNWVGQYNQYFGEAMFIPQSTRTALRDFDTGTSPLDELWEWTTSDYSRRVSELDALYWRGDVARNYQIPSGKVLNVRMAARLFSGGTVSSSYSRSQDWANQNAYHGSTAVATLDIYYRMFQENYKPKILSITSG
jgi:hypothetical protein